MLLLLSSPWKGRKRRASLLLITAVLLCVVPVSASLPASSKCPPPIDCAEARRDVCKPGSSHCGPCLSTFEENEEGRCVVIRRRHQHGKVTFYPDTDEEIDYLRSSLIQKQELAEFSLKTKQSNPTADTDVKKSKTDASKQKQKSQDRFSSENQPATTTAPQPELSALPTPTPEPRTTGADNRAGPLVVPTPRNDRIIVIIISLCAAVGAVAMILATVCYVKLQKESHLAQKIDYPAFGGANNPAATVTNTSMGDKTLAQSAQMYHYQHQKQQILSMGSHKPEQKVLETEVTSDEEEVGGDFTVYECPGLAPTGEMEVKNPLFDDSTVHYQGNQK
ncbi:neural proliferation differentiation and control protein 1a isoform X2 [Channa argus]|uniref:neural proliferation differentiation and control protein 1a isoform X2 n=1 Tax=Channa argus TaxID=215402 RepID=UPI0035222A15